KDWNISRQLWWGHRLPIWYCVACDTPVASIKEPKGKCAHCGDHAFRQDDDTLDTWFSSGLWTFSTLGWPDEASRDLKRFHPTSVLGTGWDILFFWVARMMMFSLYLRDEVPFKTIYLHGLVMNEAGKKMSKSKGTGVDPLPMADKYGTDALRLSLVVGTAPGLDFRMSEQKIAGQRNYCNKQWNISRYALSQPRPKTKTAKAISLAEKWIMARLDSVSAEVTRHLEKYQFGLAVEALQEFIWKDLADWYLEIHKVEKNTAILRHVLRQSLILLHPFAPFITETIWRAFGEKQLLMIETWPKHKSGSASVATIKAFSNVQRLVVGLRNLKLHGNRNQAVTVGLSTRDQTLLEKLTGVTIKKLTGPFVTIAGTKVTADPAVITAFSEWRTKEREQLQSYIANKKKLADNAKAPEHIREQALADQDAAESRLAELA
ncbi:MAG: class I tRNA ligase family protein, partial [Candidatus Kerfeldbacteria bacterium]|nr:class I tRNA ligase family protein [Candidatus Kerfeldbacteria bacterium]